MLSSAVVPLMAALSGFVGAPSAGERSTAATLLFEEITTAVGLEFLYRSGATGELLLPEIMGGGAALLDYDRDGDLDVYFVQGREHGAARRPSEAQSQGHRLFRNDLEDLEGSGSMPRFVDVTATLGIFEHGIGMGIATGDYDNDGWVDLYVANLGSNVLLRNEEGRVFRDVTRRAQADAPGWSVAATFFDFDRDGWLDLFVVDYLEWSRERPGACFAANTRRDYCGPTGFSPATSRLFRNRGDGTFEPFATATFAAGPGPGLGVLAIDADGDRFFDLLVANDGKPNRLWRNLAGRGFRDEGLLTGIAVNRFGLSEASMGIAPGDVDGDGDEDVLLTHLTGETNTLYLRRGAGLYEDATLLSGLAPPSVAMTGFGVALLDLDHDRDLDLVVVNGAVRLEHGRASSDVATPDAPTSDRSTAGLGQPNQVFVNQGGGRFVESSDRMPPSFLLDETSRGLAVGDFDNDRVGDLLVVNVDAPARLYRGLSGAAAPAFGLRLIERHGRDALGARVSIRTATTVAHRVVRSDGSYASAGDPRLLVPRPAPDDGAIEAITVEWPDGTSEEWTGARLAAALDAADHGYATLRQREATP